MAEIRPFRAIRYDTRRVRLPDVITEPYDKITPWMQQDYLRRSPHNYCRLILPEGDATDRYRHAADVLRRWRNDGVLRLDDGPGFTVYRQRFTSPFGAPLTRMGLLAAVRLEAPGEGHVHAHEQTMAGPRTDRLNLLRATGHHLGPVFMLASPGHALGRQLVEAPSEPWARFEWERETVQELRVVRDPAAAAGIAESVRPSRLVIADGHHRYETAFAFSRESNLAGAGFVMAMITPAEDPGLVVLATHRVLKTGQGGDTGDLGRRAAPWFRMQPASSLAELLDGLGLPGPRIGVLLPHEGFALWTLRTDAPLDDAFAGYPAPWRTLDVALLHAIVLHRLIGVDTREPADQEKVHYVRDPAEAEYLVREGDGCAAFFLRPTPAAAVMEIALKGTRMPQKSTDFYPKVPSGLVLYDASLAPPPAGPDPR